VRTIPPRLPIDGLLQRGVRNQARQRSRMATLDTGRRAGVSLGWWLGQIDSRLACSWLATSVMPRATEVERKKSASCSPASATERFTRPQTGRVTNRAAMWGGASKAQDVRRFLAHKNISVAGSARLPARIPDRCHGQRGKDASTENSISVRFDATAELTTSQGCFRNGKILFQV